MKGLLLVEAGVLALHELGLGLHHLLPLLLEFLLQVLVPVVVAAVEGFLVTGRLPLLGLASAVAFVPSSPRRTCFAYAPPLPP